MDTKSATLSETELHQLKWITGIILAWIACWALLTVDFGGQVMAVVCMLVSGLLLAFPALPGYLPSYFWKAATPILLLVICLDYFSNAGGGNIIGPTLRMTLLLIALRMVAYRHRREDLQLLLLCLFSLVITGVLMQSITFAAQMLLFSPFAMAYLFLLNMVEPSHTRTLTREDWKDFSWLPFLRRIFGSLNFRFLGFASVLFVLLAFVSSLIFMIIPRIEMNNALGFLNVERLGMIGVNDSIRFGDVSSLSDNNEVALRVEPPSRDAVPDRPYWRMLVLDRYHEGEFVSTSIQRYGQGKIGKWRGYNLKQRQGSGEGEWTFYLEGGISQYLPILGPFDSLRFTETTNFGIEEERFFVKMLASPADVVGYSLSNMQMTDSLEVLKYESRYLDRTLNNSEKLLQMIESPSDIYYPLTTLDIPLEGPDRAYLMATRDAITRGQPMEALDYLEAARDYLQTTYTYSLNDTTDYNTDTDPLIAWMQQAQAGWCEHFAGAFTLLCRAQGIPARVVVGFAGAEWNGFEGYLIVRSKMAHAWTEIHHDGAWIRVDPTPVGSLTGTQSQDLQAQLRTVRNYDGWSAWVDSLRMSWYRRVVNFDSVDQADMADDLRDTTQAIFKDLQESLKERFDGLKAWLTQGWNWQKVLRNVGLLLSLVGVLFALQLLYGQCYRWLMRRSHWFQQHVGERKYRKHAGKLLLRYRQLTGDTDSATHPQALALQSQLLQLRYGDLSHLDDRDSHLEAAKSQLKSFQQWLRQHRNVTP